MILARCRASLGSDTRGVFGLDTRQSLGATLAVLGHFPWSWERHSLVFGPTRQLWSVFRATLADLHCPTDVFRTDNRQSTEPRQPSQRLGAALCDLGEEHCDLQARQPRRLQERHCVLGATLESIFGATLAVFGPATLGNLWGDTAPGDGTDTRGAGRPAWACWEADMGVFRATLARLQEKHDNGACWERHSRS
ncbi:hypothetical protein Nepgr_033999 [Nepenthes gracilis]|uniref:Uncharacterized protein n=1 Tax=Nepenthes gracilis TaxID=150966 RepID=A0AAD3TM50_NEPGR|nr:hypothetical protein Nepgr_033999 [Nepenthes gracilis]